jgi:hypothetical protein
VDAINPAIHESFLKPAKIELPQSPEVAREWWKGRAPVLLEELRRRVFRNWPEKPPPLNARLAADVKHGGLRLRAYDFVSEDQVELRLWLIMSETVDKPTLVVLNVLDEPGWQEWITDLGPAFKEALQLKTEPKQNANRFAQEVKTLQSHKWGFAAITPRGIGPTRWSETSSFDGKPNGNQIRRRFALLGQTLEGQRVWDVRRALACLRTVPDLKGVPLWLQGKNDMAGVALYASLFEPDVARLDLWHLSPSHRQGPIFLNVLRVLDMPQAVALAFPRKVRLYVKDVAETRSWDWPMRLQKALGQHHLQIRRVGD